MTLRSAGYISEPSSIVLLLGLQVVIGFHGNDWVRAKLQKRGLRKTETDDKITGISIGDPHVADLETKLRDVFATKVQLKYAQGKGSLEISFFSDAELERILQILGVAER